MEALRRARPYFARVRADGEARVVLVIFALLMTFGEANAHEHHNRFSLYTGCDAMELHVGVDIENSSLSLSPENVRTAVEARVRAARLYQPDDDDSSTVWPHFLVVEVSGSSVAFHVRLQFYRLLAWHSGGRLTKWWRQEYPDGREPLGFASTWANRAVGTHDGTPTVVLSVVSQLMDGFLVDYLRVNEEAC